MNEDDEFEARKALERIDLFGGDMLGVSNDIWCMRCVFELFRFSIIINNINSKITSY